MTHLNSLLLEGCISDDPSIIELTVGPCLTFDIQSNITLQRGDGPPFPHTLTMTVECWKVPLIRALGRELSRGMGVRVIGRVAFIGGKHSIVAETIETKRHFNRQLPDNRMI